MQTVYILYSKKLNRFYTGYSSDFDTRIFFHENTEIHKFTAKANDWVLFLNFKCETKSQALKIEGHIKRMKSSTYIKNLKKYPEMVERLILKYES